METYQIVISYIITLLASVGLAFIPASIAKKEGL